MPNFFAALMVSAVAAAQLADPIPGPIPNSGIKVELEPVVTGLAAPLGMEFVDDGSGRAFVYDQAGQIIVLQNGTNAGVLLDVSARLVTLGFNGGPFDERGLLGLAVHPDFASNPRIYTYTSEPAAGIADFPVPGGPVDHHGVVAEWTVAGNTADTNSRRELLRFEEPQFNHNGGPLRFGPEGLLYIALGDGGGADDDAAGHGAEGNGQNLETVLGKLLRIDVDIDGGDVLGVNGQYAIPQDNPFVAAPGLDEIYAYGFRNPYAFTFDQATGDLYLADVGQNDIEELNIVHAGGNYGWRIKEGSFQFDPNGAGPGFVFDQQPVPGLIDPIAEYDHDEGLSIIGGYVYHGADSRLAGRYVAGDFSRSFANGMGRLFFVDGANTFQELLIGAQGNPLNLFVKGFAQDPAGEVYLCASSILGPFGSTGAVYRLAPITPLPAAGLQTLLLIALLLLAAGVAALRLVSARR